MIRFFVNYIFIVYLFDFINLFFWRTNDVINLCSFLYNFGQTLDALTFKKVRMTYNLE